MRSNNALVIPTLGNFNLLENLSKYINMQTYDDFNIVFVVGTGVDLSMFKEKMVRVLNRSYTTIVQNEDRIIGAMNTILGLNFKVIALTDDDAKPSPSYVANAIHFLESNDNAGMVFGKVNGIFPDSKKLKLLRLINTSISRKSLFGINPYRHFNAGGLISGGFIPVQHRVMEDYSPIGVCMAWRQDMIGNFRLESKIRHGILYESYISAALWKKGLNTYFSPELYVNHIERESLSRKKNVSNEILEEIYYSPHILYEMGFDIDIKILHRFVLLTKLLPKDIKSAVNHSLIDFINNYY